ncbi:MAG: DUF4412 domain-containing protein [Syntrophorhabdaceae bacterium]|nr:DUF4412 domain-containing protein [Syntrophorhabdaceae bacterium]
MKEQAVKVFLVLCIWMAAALLPHDAIGASFADFTKPSADYSADRIITMDGKNMMAGKVYAAPDKERMEIKDAGGTANVIRMDKKLVWTLIPSQKMYMEYKFSDQKGQRTNGDYNECDVRHAEKGKEEVNGFKTRKMEVEVSCPGGDKHTGIVWLTNENIPVRTEMLSAGSKKEKVRMELKNLKIGKQDPALFEVPAGYKLMVMPSMKRK